MSAYPVNARQGRVTIAAGVGAVFSGLVLQALSVQSAATEAPPQFGSNPGLGNTALLAGIAWLLIVAGVVLTVIGVIRYAQSGRPAAAVTDQSSVPVSTPAFCSACGAGIVGEGRFCASCGAPAR